MSNNAVEQSPQEQATLRAAVKEFGITAPHLGRLNEVLAMRLREPGLDDDSRQKINKFYKKHRNLVML